MAKAMLISIKAIGIVNAITVLMASCYGQSWASYFTKVIIILHIMLLLRNIIIISKLYILPRVCNRASLLWTLN